MIVEMRTYTLALGATGRYFKLYGEKGLAVQKEIVRDGTIFTVLAHSAIQADLAEGRLSAARIVSRKATYGGAPLACIAAR